MYDPNIGRWNGVDQLSEQYIRSSPFSYALDNPIKYTDPDGNSVRQCCEGGVARDIERNIQHHKTKEEFFETSRAIGDGGVVGLSIVSPLDEVMILGWAGGKLFQFSVLKPLGKLSWGIGRFFRDIGRKFSGKRTSKQVREAFNEGGEFFDDSARMVDQPFKQPIGPKNPKVQGSIKRGKQAHKEFAEKVKAKEGWVSEPQNLVDPETGGKVIPDAVTPSGRPVELKPNTPTGRVQGKRQLPQYERATGKKGRVVYYDP